MHESSIGFLCFLPIKRPLAFHFLLATLPNSALSPFGRYIVAFMIGSSPITLLLVSSLGSLVGGMVVSSLVL